MNYVMETQNLSKKYQNVTVVDHVNLHIPKGKIYGLLGRNGAGKTTIMKMMLQLVSPTAGKIMMFGKDHREQMKDTYQKIGSIIETPGFYTNLTGQENLEILARFRKNVSKASVKHALEVVGLDQEKKKPFSDYSLGMKQRLGIAAAIMHEPELLILDEPINGLDPSEYIYPGQTILVPKQGVSVYITTMGDTIQNIARYFNTTVANLSYNNNNIYLLPDQLIVYRNM